MSPLLFFVVSSQVQFKLYLTIFRKPRPFLLDFCSISMADLEFQKGDLLSFHRRTLVHVKNAQRN